MPKFAVLALTTLLTISAFAGNAFAIDSAKCPDTISLKVDVERVYQTSIYSKLPGWKEAQATLQALGTIETKLELKSRTSVCKYEDAGGNKAVLSTAAFQDPEERNPSLVDQVVLNLKIDKSTYVSFVPVKTYDRSGVTLYSQPFSVKVKTRLYVPQTKRWANVDLGQILTTLN